MIMDVRTKAFLMISLAVVCCLPVCAADDSSAASKEYTEVFDASHDISGFIRLTGQLGQIGNSGNNAVAMLQILPNTEYTISADADNRFRVGMLAFGDMKNDHFLENFYVSPLDDNGSSRIGHATCTLISGDDEDTLLIFYYTSTDSVVSRNDVRSSISVLRTDRIFEVTFDGSGGVPSAGNAEGFRIALPNATHEASVVTDGGLMYVTSYTLAHWAETPDGASVGIVGDSYSPNADITLYAVWNITERIIYLSAPVCGAEAEEA